MKENTSNNKLELEEVLAKEGYESCDVWEYIGIKSHLLLEEYGLENHMSLGEVTGDEIESLGIDFNSERFYELLSYEKMVENISKIKELKEKGGDSKEIHRANKEIEEVIHDLRKLRNKKKAEKEDIEEMIDAIDNLIDISQIMRNY